MSAHYPLRFRPLFRRYLWGGRRLGSLLHKPIGPEGDYAESWEIVDHGADQSVVLAGAWEGQTLGQLVERQGQALLGSVAAPRGFPLLLKFLDAHQNLSVQVHPDDQAAAQLEPPDSGKTEAWVVLHAEPGSVLYAGLKRGFDRAALAREVHRGTTELCLHRLQPRVGDCFFIPAGVVHALGAGLVVAEIQQASDTTFRLYDWNRRGPDGRPRTLHVEQALKTIDDQHGPVEPQAAQPTDQRDVERLVECDQFVLQRRRMSTPRVIGGDGRFRILAVLQGEVSIQDDPLNQPLRLGQTALLPADLGPTRLTPHAPTTLLEAYVA